MRLVLPELGAALGAAGIGNKGYYRTPLHRQVAMRPWSDVELPGTDEAARTHLAIPMSPVLTREQAERLREVPRRDQHLVAARPEGLDDGPHDEHVRGVREVDPDAQGGPL